MFVIIAAMSNAPDFSAPLPTPDEASQVLQGALGQITFARRYVLEMLDSTPHELWFQIPPGLSTHIAWQIGHLTVSQYGLLMFRVRGRQPEDLLLMPSKFRKAYARASTPNPDPTEQPTATELLDHFSRVHERALSELATVDPRQLSDPVDMPYAAYPTKLGAILFCPMHEMLHAGQIGVIRRALGLVSLR